MWNSPRVHVGPRVGNRPARNTALMVVRSTTGTYVQHTVHLSWYAARVGNRVHVAGASGDRDIHGSTTKRSMVQIGARTGKAATSISPHRANNSPLPRCIAVPARLTQLIHYLNRCGFSVYLGAR
jgi:hypothetical protein